MPDQMYVRLGAVLRRHRDQVGMTQAELACRVGLSRTSITNIECGRQPMLVHQFCVFADILRFDVCQALAELRASKGGSEVAHTSDFENLFGKLEENLEEEQS